MSERIEGGSFEGARPTISRAYLPMRIIAPASTARLPADRKAPSATRVNGCGLIRYNSHRYLRFVNVFYAPCI